MPDDFEILLAAERLQKLQNKFDEFSKTYELPTIDIEAEKQNKIAIDAEITTELERLKRDIQIPASTKTKNTNNQNSDRDKINLCYRIFGLKPGASLLEVKQAHRKLIKKYHPDLFFDNPQKQQAEEMMKKINKAYTKIHLYTEERSL